MIAKPASRQELWTYITLPTFLLPRVVVVLQAQHHSNVVCSVDCSVLYCAVIPLSRARPTERSNCLLAHLSGIRVIPRTVARDNTRLVPPHIHSHVHWDSIARLGEDDCRTSPDSQGVLHMALSRTFTCAPRSKDHMAVKALGAPPVRLVCGGKPCGVPSRAPSGSLHLARSSPYPKYMRYPPTSPHTDITASPDDVEEHTTTSSIPTHNNLVYPEGTEEVRL